MRNYVARLLERRLETIVGQTVAVFPYAGPQALDTNDRARLGEAAMQLLVPAVRDGALDARDGHVATMRRLAQDRSIGPQQLFSLIFLLERAALDEVAEALRSDADQWDAVAQLVRRASVDVMGAFAERLTHERGVGELTDPLTTLHAGAVLESALEKEIHRAERFGHPLAVVLFDVDRMAAINARHGFGFGDRVLERLGILMRTYFREQDWVARWAEDAFAVLLTETLPAHAELLAERVRVMVQDRLKLRDYRTEERVSVTVSVGVVLAEAVDMELTVQQVRHHAEQAVYRAKEAGRNRIERIDVSATSLSVLGAARRLGITPTEVLDLVNEGRLSPVHVARNMRFDRHAIDAYGTRRKREA